MADVQLENIEGAQDATTQTETNPIDAASGYDAYLAYQAKLNHAATPLDNKEIDTDLDSSTDGTILANTQEPPKSDEPKPTVDRTAEETDEAATKSDEAASEASKSDEGTSEPKAAAESENPAEPVQGSDESGTTGDEVQSGDRPLSEYAKRYQKSNDRIRNAINSAKFIEQEAAKRIKEASADFLAPDKVLEYVKKNREAPKLLEEFTVEDLTGTINPYTMAQEGGRIDETTGDIFTEEAAKYFIKKRSELNEKTKAEFDAALNQEVSKTLAQTEQEIQQIASKAAQDSQKLNLVLDTYPELDLENEKLPEQYKTLANAFWQEVADKYSDKIFNEELLKDDFDIEKAAKDFLTANKDYIKKIDEQLFKTQEQPEPKETVDKGVIAPSGTSSSPSADEPADKEELEIGALARKFTENYKESNHFKNQVSGRKLI